MTTAIGLIDAFSSTMVLALIAILGVLVLIGLVNAVIVIGQVLSARFRGQPGPAGGQLPEGLMPPTLYLNSIADVLLVAVGIELADTLTAFLTRANPKVYLSGVVGAALVAITRRIIVFFNPAEEQVKTGEIYSYAVLIAVLAGSYVLIQLFG